VIKKNDLKKNKQNEESFKYDSKKKNLISTGSVEEDITDIKKLRGFLDMNPFICSGCGAQFQCKKVDTPGFLPPDKFLVYRSKADLIQKQQEAVRLLTSAAIPLDSAVADETLKIAGIEEAVIRGVKKQALKLKMLSGKISRDQYRKDVQQYLTPTTSLLPGEEQEHEQSGQSLQNDQQQQDPQPSLSSSSEINEDLQKYLKTKVKGNTQLMAPDPRSLIDKLQKQKQNETLRPDYDNFAIEKLKHNKDQQKLMELLEIDAPSTLPREFSNLKKILKNPPTAVDENANPNTATTTTAAPGVGKEESTAAPMGTDAKNALITSDLQNQKLLEEDETLPVCQRCYRLQQYGQVEDSLRPGWSENELLTPERFESLLSNLKKTDTVILCLIDIFDLQGSMIKNLKEIVGNNPLFIGVNKIDLLPSDISSNRVLHWVYKELKRNCDFLSPSEARHARVQFYEQKRDQGFSNNKNDLEQFQQDLLDGGNDELKKSESKPFKKKLMFQEYEKLRKLKQNEEKVFISEEKDGYGILKQENVFLMSCNNGDGIEHLMKSLLQSAEKHGKRIHVMGAANVGKSSFINRIMNPKLSPLKDRNSHKYSRKEKEPAITVSNLPGTTLNFLKMKLVNNIYMIDTPGLINKGHLTSKLTPAELREVIPSKPINAVTFRLEAGQAVLLGGLARLEITEGRPFFFTFFISNEIKLHVTKIEKVDQFIEKHMGELIYPPHSMERVQTLEPFESYPFKIDGIGWNESSTDIVIPGLGWVAVTGSGSTAVNVVAPFGTEVSTRPALLPFEAKYSTAKYTGARIDKKSHKKNVKSYGWRA
jgi:ribosome biogenesis GTPase A